MHWARLSGLRSDIAEQQTVLCLHAGNLPLVGLQDLLAVMLTSGRYIGKLSRKDPYLLPTLIDKFIENCIECDYRYETDLNSFEGLNADRVLFAGSDSSADPVKKKLLELKITDQLTPMLIRTAHFSIAWIHDQKPETMEALMEAVFRYAGRGCRSVAIIVAPFSFTSNSCNLTDYIESFWIKNPQISKPPESLNYRYAMNKAVGISQIWLTDFLIEEKLQKPDSNFVLHWVEGGREEVSEIVRKYDSGLQSVYTHGPQVGDSIEGRVFESLKTAQNPPIWWKPDGVDTIEWLQNQNRSIS